MKTVITITGIRPDFIRMSEIFKKLDKKFLDRLKKSDYSKAAELIPIRNKKAFKIAFPATEVGKLIFNALHNPNRKTRYTITPNKMMYWTIPMTVTDRMLDSMIKKQSGF